jgi:hypothetical protein
MQICTVDNLNTLLMLCYFINEHFRIVTQVQSLQNRNGDEKQSLNSSGIAMRKVGEAKGISGCTALSLIKFDCKNILNFPGALKNL